MRAERLERLFYLFGLKLIVFSPGVDHERLGARALWVDERELGHA